MKRFLDIFFSLCAVFIFLPVLAIVAILVALKIGRPIFFSQIRPGLHGRPFCLVKFRTMMDKRDAVGRLLSDEVRLAPFGRLVRALSLDELPELWNVLKGEMSLVGPRPLLMEYLPLYNQEQARRHAVKPGITGWAQVNGRNALSWEEKFALDVWYVDHQSFWLDLKILFMTVLNVLKREGISSPGNATMPLFLGSSTIEKK